MDLLSELEKCIVESTFDSALEFLSCFDEGHGQEKTSTVSAERKLVSKRQKQSANQQHQSSSTSKRRFQRVVKHEETLTSFKRRKLERIKAPVVVFRNKRKSPQGPNDKEQEKSVTNTLAYLSVLPTQEIYEPPPTPLVTFGVGFETAAGTNTDSLHHEKDKCEPDSILEYEYLTHEKDISLWKLVTSSPTNCNVFVGNLSQQVSNEVLMATFQEFCDLSVRDELKVHVVMNATKQQSKGFGFVNFPTRRAAELAMLCMQEFELYGRVMQLGWGQDETNTSQSSSSTATVSLKQMSSSCDVQQSLPIVSGVASVSPNFSALARVQKLVSSLPALQHKLQTSLALGKEEEQKNKNPKFGRKVSDTLYSSQCQRIKPVVVLQKKSRWDQEVRKVSLECNAESRVSKNSGNLPSDGTVDALYKTCGTELRVKEMKLKESISTLEHASMSSLLVSNVNEDTVNVSSNEGVYSHFIERNNAKDEKTDTRTFKDCPTVYDDKTMLDEHEADSETARHLISINKTNNEDIGCQVSSETHSEKVDVACKEMEGKTRKTLVPRKLQWLTKKQKVELLKHVCSRLRAAGVAGHVGVFGLHYEADNSRLYVVCAKQVTETELLEHFLKFGKAEVKLNRDSNGASKVLVQNPPDTSFLFLIPKGCAFVHYVNPTRAAAAMKSSHGQVLGGLPMKVMVAEPKSRSGSKKKTRNP